MIHISQRSTQTSIMNRCDLFVDIYRFMVSLCVIQIVSVHLCILRISNYNEGRVSVVGYDWLHGFMGYKLLFVYLI